MKKNKPEKTWEERYRSACEDWKASGGSVHSLAVAAGIDHAQLYRFIAGSQSLGIERAERLGHVLGFELIGPKQPRKSH